MITKVKCKCGEVELCQIEEGDFILFRDKDTAGAFMATAEDLIGAGVHLPQCTILLAPEGLEALSTKDLLEILKQRMLVEKRNGQN